ncbi:hypothetical protein GOB93_09205 [Acetobacter musti]|uniref:Transposase n=1 Tax=Acetobacter musti TaxID=864732 RepID=A0ABX0JS86_9PROT|nr:hypothetical protein [Acetobacter musti]NHN84815.1 hypothetical protein [Acetobacter musti]
MTVRALCEAVKNTVSGVLSGAKDWLARTIWVRAVEMWFLAENADGLKGGVGRAGPDFWGLYRPM